MDNVFTNHGIDWKFIMELEGHAKPGINNKAYVPKNADGTPHSNSGITLPYGVDLGHMTAKEISALKEANEALYDKLKGYLYAIVDGAKGAEAQAMLDDEPLSLDYSQCLQLFLIKQAGIIEPMIKQYDTDTYAGAWNVSNKAPRTIMASLAWQYGVVWKRCPKFWQAVCKASEWLDDYKTNPEHQVMDFYDPVISELREFGDAFPTRRNKEADYLASALQQPIGA